MFNDHNWIEMIHKRLSVTQKEWLGWILEVQRDWLNIHINAPVNIEKLYWSYITGIYDAPTQQLLNFILNRFNEHTITKGKWKIHNKWKIKTNKDLEL